MLHQPLWRSRLAFRIALLLMSSFLALLVVWQIAVRLKPLQFRTVIGPMTLRSHSQSTGDMAFTVKAGDFESYKFVVPKDQLYVTLQGHFSVGEGNENDIEVYVLSDLDYTNWQNGYTTFRFYDSGKVAGGDMNVSLLADPAWTYYVVFNNRFSAATPKYIQANMTLRYCSFSSPGIEE